MKKREFLAVGGAVPLMLAGCGGDGSGSAPMRLVNASVGYPSLGFMDNTNQIASGIAYGSASPFASVEAGTVPIVVTVTDGNGANSAASSTTRNLSKDSRYNLIAYGYPEELKSILLTERTDTPTDGYAEVSALNTSVDIGAVDVYLATNPGDLSAATQIGGQSVGNNTQPAQTGFSALLPGTYYLIVTGASAKSDIRFAAAKGQEIVLANQRIYNIILTPGVSGTLTNAIFLTQGDDSIGSKLLSFANSSARLRIVASLNDPAAKIKVSQPTSDPANPVNYILPAAGVSNLSPTNYLSVNVSALPTVVVNATQLPPATDPAGNAVTLQAGGDYTLLVYVDPAAATPTYTSVILADDNTIPAAATKSKIRLINLAYDPSTADHSLNLALRVNADQVASNIDYPSASAYAEFVVSTNESTVQLYAGGAPIASSLQKLQLFPGRVYTDIVFGTGTPANPETIKNSFFSTTTLLG